jgi:hypothetical protein
MQQEDQNLRQEIRQEELDKKREKDRLEQEKIVSICPPFNRVMFKNLRTQKEKLNWKNKYY